MATKGVTATITGSSPRIRDEPAVKDLIIQANATHIPLRDKSVQCVVTSPPYWGLRDYGTATWEGGDGSDCDHRRLAYPPGRETPGGRGGSMPMSETPYRDLCGKCGARRIDAQIGLEPTPEEYVAALVEVFREVRRVLRDDGTLWLNLGSSYASGDSAASRSRHAPRALSYGTDDITRRDSLVTDSAYSGLCDGCRAVLGGFHTEHISRPSSLAERPLLPTARDSEHVGYDVAPRPSSPRDESVSTMHESLQRQLAVCSHCANCGACLSVLRSSSRDAQACVRRMVGSVGITPIGETSADRTAGKAPSSMAWGYYTSTLKPKDLVPTPWMVAMALQADGWYLRCDVIWAKKSCMPESVTDRPTKSHEYIFLLSKSATYYYDAEAVKERATSEGPRGGSLLNGTPKGSNPDRNDNGWTGERALDWAENGRNRRSVWNVATQAFSGAHFAVFPEDLVKPCVLAGSKPGDTVLDPFAGSGTTLYVAKELGRIGIGTELKADYIALARNRTRQGVLVRPETP